MKKFFIKVFRFFVPKNFHEELIKGAIIGEQIKHGQVAPNMIPTWYIGKWFRKLIDPKHQMKIGKDKDGNKN